jgi:inosine-uridine nucleoside N-ribohydrolase
VTTRVILDCDTANEIDDQFAIAYALGSPNLDVVAVVSVHDTMVHGAGSVELYQEEAERVVALCGADGRVHCVRGAAAPMEDKHSPVPSAGLDLLIEEARRAPFTLLATGPATDIASFVLTAPELRDRVRVLWAGGFPDEETWQLYKFGELNARADIASWRRLFEDPIELVQLPGWPGVAKVTVEWRDCVERLRSLARPACEYLAEITEKYAARRGFDLDMDSTRGQEKVLWDIVNVAFLCVPDAIHLEERALPTLDAAGAGDWSRPGRVVPIAIDVDPQPVLDDMWTALAQLPGAKT